MGTIGIIGNILGLYWDHGKKMETTIILGLYGGYIGIMEKKMETTIMGSIGDI